MDDINNKGYYQELDETRDDYNEFKTPNCKPDAGLRANIDRYKNIEHNSFTKNGRAKFCSVRHKIHEVERREYLEAKANGVYDLIKPNEVLVECKNCKCGFVAKKADRKRGWAKFCSKSCKAQY